MTFTKPKNRFWKYFPIFKHKIKFDNNLNSKKPDKFQTSYKIRFTLVPNPKYF